MVNFIYNRSLWIDEAMLSTNIICKSYLELLKPLDMNQVAPVGFLIIEKTFINIFGEYDWALRIFPLMSYFLSIYFLYRLCILVFDSKILAITTTAIFSLNVLLIYFSSEVKQYSSDVLISVLIFYSTFYFNKERSQKALLLLTIIGIVGIWISNICIVILFTSSLFLIYKRNIKQDKYDNSIIIPIAAWAMFFLFYYFLFINHHPLKSYMLDYWSNCGAFLPNNLFSPEFYNFIYFKLGLIFNYMFRFRTYWFLGFIVFLIGLISSLMERNKIVLLIFPLFIHLGLSALKLYPFDTRLILYQIPLFIVFFVKGMFLIYNLFCKKIFHVPIYLILAPSLLNIYSVKKQTPYQRQEIKKSLEFINSKIKVGESIYVYQQSVMPFKFYKANYQKINNSNIVYGVWNKNNIDSLKMDLDKINSTTWIIFSNVYEIYNWSDEQYFIDALKLKGFQIMNQRKFVGSSCYQVSLNK